MTAPRCRNPKCGKPRRKRPNQPGYAGALGFCQGCYERWTDLGQPDDLPELTPLSERNAAARQRATEEREERMAEFLGYRARGCSVAVAARYTGVAKSTGEAYETEFRRRQRQEASAA